MEQNLKASSSEFIHLQVTVDTDMLIGKYRSQLKNTSPDNPFMINDNFFYAVVSTNAAISGQGTSNIKFAAVKDDKLRVYATSEYGNLDNPVLIYNIHKLSGDDILKNFQSHKTSKVAVQPCNPDEAHPEKVLPPVYTEMAFWYFEASVANKGKESFTFHFALYERVRTQDNPQLIGYFKWDPTIQVDR